MSVKVNFKVVSVEPSNGTIDVMYWGDGITEDEYNIGPFTIPVDADFDELTDEEMFLSIGQWGIPKVEEQLRIKELKNNGVNDRISSVVNKTIASTYYTVDEASDNTAVIVV